MFFLSYAVDSLYFERQERIWFFKDSNFYCPGALNMEQHWHKLSPFLHLWISSNDALYYHYIKTEGKEKTEHLICSESIILIVSENFSTCNVHLHIFKGTGKK